MNDCNKFYEQCLAYLDGFMPASEVEAFARMLVEDDRKRAEFSMLCYRIGLIREATTERLAESQESENADDSSAVMFDSSNSIDCSSETNTADAPGSEASTLLGREIDSAMVLEALNQELQARAKATRESDEAARQAKEERQERRRLQRMLAGQSDSGKPAARVIVIPRYAFYGGIAALIAILVMIALQGNDPENGSNGPAITSGSQRKFNEVGELIEQRNAEWRLASHELAPGKAIFDEQITLIAGLAKIRLHSGAELLLQGPCTIEPTSAMEVRLVEGKLVGVCEPASSKGFAVVTPQMRVVDVGTEFGVAVNGAKRTRVAVFRGEVDALVDNQPNRPPAAKRVQTFEAVEVARDSNTIVPVNLGTFEESFVRHLDDEDSDPAIDLAQAIMGDRPIAYWPLNEPASASAARDTLPRQIDGSAARGVKFGERFEFGAASLGAAVFDGTGMVKMGAAPELELRSDFTVEFLCRFDKTEGLCGWMIASYRHGFARSVQDAGKVNRGWGVGYNVSQAGNPEQWHPGLHFGLFGHFDFYFHEFKPVVGQWMHMVFVCDRRGDVSLYLDGELVSKVEGAGVPPPLPRCEMTIGGIVTPQSQYTRWQGAMSNVAVYGRALTREEIAHHYRVLAGSD